MLQSSLIPFAIDFFLEKTEKGISRTDWWATSQSCTLSGQGAPYSALSTAVIVKVMFLFWCLFCAPRIMFLCTFVAETFIRHNNLIWSRFTWQGRWRLRPSMWCWSWRHCRHSCDSLSCCCWCPLRPAALALFDCTVSSWRSLFLSLSLEYSIFSWCILYFCCCYHIWSITWSHWFKRLTCSYICYANKFRSVGSLLGARLCEVDIRPERRRCVGSVWTLSVMCKIN
jgi:hypothetical protein